MVNSKDNLNIFSIVFISMQSALVGAIAWKTAVYDGLLVIGIAILLAGICSIIIKDLWRHE